MLADGDAGAGAEKALLIAQWRMVLSRHLVDKACASVMPSVGILGPGVTEAHKQIHDRIHASSGVRLLVDKALLFFNGVAVVGFVGYFLFSAINAFRNGERCYWKVVIVAVL